MLFPIFCFVTLAVREMQFFACLTATNFCWLLCLFKCNSVWLQARKYLCNTCFISSHGIWWPSFRCLLSGVGTVPWSCSSDSSIVWLHNLTLWLCWILSFGKIEWDFLPFPSLHYNIDAFPVLIPSCLFFFLPIYFGPITPLFRLRFCPSL